MKSFLLLFLIFTMMFPLSAYANDSQVNIKLITSTQTTNPFQLKHENGTILFAIYRDGVITAGTIPKERIQSSGTWSVSDIPVLPQSQITNLVSDLLGKQSVVSGISDIEISWLDGVTSAIQNQLNGKQISGNYLTSPILQSDVTNLASDLSAKESVSSHNADNSTITIGLNSKQPLDSDLTVIGGLSPSDNDVLQRKSSAWINRSPSELKTDLSLTKTDVGLANVDNTSDTNKPVSSATQTALDSKQSSLGYTPENSANKNATDGYAPLNSLLQLTNNLVSAKQIPLLSASKAMVSNSSGYIDVSSLVSATELDYLDNMDANIKTSLDSKYSSSNRQTSIVTSEISDEQITYGKIQNVVNDDRILGRVSGANGDIEELTSTQFTSLVNAFTQTLNGLVPAPITVSGRVLSDDGTWINVSGSGISEISTVQGGSARLSQTNSTTEVVLKHFLDSVTIAFINDTNSVSAGIITGSIGDTQLGTNIDTTQFGSGSVTSTEFGYVGGLTSDAQAQLDSKYSSSNRQTSIVNSEISTVDASKMTSGTLNVARLGSGTPDGTKFLRDDNTWVTPSSGGSSGITVLASDVTCTQTSSYCTVFTVPLTASSGNNLSVKLVGDSNTAGSAIQMRVQFDNSGNTGYCLYRTYTTATAEVLDTLLATATTDTGETVWLAGANIPMPLNIDCGFETDATPGNALVQIQMEVASTGTVQKGSNYIKTP